jgi:two-component system chemotaxis sensor kinase CheA
MDDEFLKKLLSTFRVEAEEHLRNIYSCLIEMEKAEIAEHRTKLIETMFREAHSLKGAARSVNLGNIESICQSLEGVLAAMKSHEKAPSPEAFNLLHEAADFLGRLVSSAGGKPPPSEKSRLQTVLLELKSLTEDSGPVRARHDHSRTEAGEPGPSPTESVRISTSRLKSILLQTEEMLSAKLAGFHRTMELRKVSTALAEWDKTWEKVRPEAQSIRATLEKMDRHGQNDKINSRMNRLFEFLDWNFMHIKSMGKTITSLSKSDENDSRSLVSMIDSLLKDVREALMFQFSSHIEMFPRLVRNLSRDEGKDVELVIQAGDIEIDRRILEEMKDPFVHLVRNCIDHGIERPEVRALKNKPARGKITISVVQTDSNNVEIVISDDGAGISIEGIKNAALKQGVISREEEEKLGDQEALSLIFQSGVSTSSIITDISGRGIGLAIVREKVENLGGAISLETRPDSGTLFRIQLPLTLSTFRGILVRAGDHLFVLPSTNVTQVLRVRNEEIKTVENRQTIRINERVLSLFRCEDILELPRMKNEKERSDFTACVVLGAADRHIALSVDEILNDREILVKNLGSQLVRVRNVSSATVLGTGRVVPILNVSDLIKSSYIAPSPVREDGGNGKAPERRKSILVVEDSITSRTLLKNILESAGYSVTTAVDGVEGIMRLKHDDFELVVSDVDMPRLNGFGLTEKIREDRKLAETPVVLVTALESNEDRVRGIDAGANAYIVKSSFDQSNLLEIVRRLI